MGGLSKAGAIAYYALVYVGLSVLALVIVWAIERFAGGTINGGSIGWVPPIVAAMVTGQRYGAKMGAAPSGGYSWAVSFGFVLVNILISLPVFYGMALYAGVPFDSVDSVLAAFGIARDDLPLMLAIMGGFILLLWVLLRFMFSFGARQAVKAAARGR